AGLVGIAALEDVRSNAADGAMDERRYTALLAAEIAVAARHGEAIRLAHGGRADDRQRHREIAHDLADHSELLEILLTEYRNIRRDLLEELGADGRDTAEEVRPEVRLEALSGARRHDARRESIRIHLLDSRRPHEMAIGRR